MGAVMEWVVKLEAKSGWGEVETIEVGRLERRVVGLPAGEVGLTLAEGRNLLDELVRLILRTQMEEFTTCARVCRDCLKLRRLRDQRTRKVHTLFGSRKLSSNPVQVSGRSHPGQTPVQRGFRDLAQRDMRRTRSMRSARLDRRRLLAPRVK